MLEETIKKFQGIIDEIENYKDKICGKYSEEPMVVEKYIDKIVLKNNTKNKGYEYPIGTVEKYRVLAESQGFTLAVVYEIDPYADGFDMFTYITELSDFVSVPERDFVESCIERLSEHFIGLTVFSKSQHKEIVEEYDKEVKKLQDSTLAVENEKLEKKICNLECDAARSTQRNFRLEEYIQKINKQLEETQKSKLMEKIKRLEKRERELERSIVKLTRG